MKSEPQENITSAEKPPMRSNTAICSILRGICDESKKKLQGEGMWKYYKSYPWRSGPGVSELVEKTGWSARKARSVINKLALDGKVRVERRAGGCLTWWLL